MKTPWIESPTVELNLALAPQERYAAIPDALVRRGRALLNSVSEVIPAHVKPLAFAADMATGNRFTLSAKALAQRHDASFSDVMLANISYDLMINSLGCTTAVLPSPNGPVVARNMDWAPEDLLARASCLMRYQRNGKVAFTHAGWPGSLGVVTGMSANGFALVVNAASAPDKPSLSAYPVLLFLRKVLEDAANFDEALKMLRDQPLAASAMISLAGTRNDQRVVIERSPNRNALRWADAGKPLVTTNHFRALYPPPEDERVGCPRYSRACELLDGVDFSEEIDDTALLAGLSDERVIQTITAQHVIMRPALKQMRLFVPRRLLN